MAESPGESPALDPAVPNVARMYDFMLGGKENYASDRAAVARLIALLGAGLPPRRAPNATRRRSASHH